MSQARDVLEGTVGAAGMLLAFFTPFLRARREHWGLSAELASRELPGDALVGPGAFQWTHGLEIDAPAARAWPWIAQLGQDRGGFYSYEFLENLAGCHVHNADRVHPEWQERRVGDGLRLHPTLPPLPITEIVPGLYMVAGGEMEGGVRVSWVFVLEPIDALRCRFISRFRLASPPGTPGLSPQLIEPVGFVMDRKMLLGVRERAEGEHPTPTLADVGPLDLAGKICLVTGATRGIGRETARWLARAGARVGLLCRDRGRAEALRATIRGENGRDSSFVVELDLASMASVRHAAREILVACPRIDALVHNAGDFRQERELTVDGHERMLAVGYLGPWLLTRRLESRLIESGARVVVTAGIYHRRGHLDLSDMHFVHRPWDAMAANNQMQLARASWAFELARLHAKTGVTVNAVHPGAVRTDAQEGLGELSRALLDTLGRLVFVDAERGALPNLRLAGELALRGVTGRYYHGLHEAEASEAARDPALARRLWDWTEATLD